MPTVVLRAAVVLGSGSASFEMLRYLTERLPVMVTPRWVHSRIQPIAVRDVLRYLVGCAPLPPSVHRCFDIGGPDVMNYAEMMQRYAVVAGLPRRRILPVPLFSPSLSSHWVGLITPVPAGIARPLVESLRNTVVCREHDIAEFLPDPPEGLLGFDEAVRLAVQRVRDSAVATRWASASVPGAPSDPLPTDPDWAGRQPLRRRADPAPRPPARGRCGGSSRASAATTAGTRSRWPGRSAAGWTGWSAGWGCAGVGGTRGRLFVGDALDFWRVEEREARPPAAAAGRDAAARPGLARVPRGTRAATATVLRQRATFAPHGLAGHLYWWGIAASTASCSAA